MSVAWSSLTFTPPLEALQELAASWGWLLREPFMPVLFSSLGDVFIEPDSGGVWWLNTGIAELTQVADSVEHFESLLKSELADEWFLPNLVEQLHAAGKVPGPGECYTFVTMPIFREGKYEVDNINPVPAREHYGLTGSMHKRLRELVDGAHVQVKVATS
ncbi:T6SS immunity protein Tdi1 domain-containing protein [Acidovorax sp. LjRoot117]|uniref:T6SS immunity protein Tdi1 domain-containing protein n=1 Tax=Acidovorax sp. LjRoot117 TaxID=3342255 RepID=UPI003ECF8CF8